MSLLTGARQIRSLPTAQKNTEDAVRKAATEMLLRAAGEHLLQSLAGQAEEARQKAEAESRHAQEQEQLRQTVEAKLVELEALNRQLTERGAQREQEFASMQTRVREVETSTAGLQEQLLAREAETTELRAAMQRSSEEYTRTLAEAKAAAEKAAVPPEPRVIYQPPVRPQSIKFEPIRDRNGLLSRVVLKAEGYEDVAVDIVRGIDNRIQSLKIGGTQK